MLSRKLKREYGIDIDELKKSPPYFEPSKELIDRIQKLSEQYAPVVIKVSVWNFCHDLYDGNYQGVYESPVFEALEKLCQGHSEMMLPKETAVYRARIISDDDLLGQAKGISYTDEGFSGYDYINSKEPPIGFSKSGRANVPYSSYLYCAEDIETAACEVKPYIGDYISVATFKTKKDFRLINFVDLSNDMENYDQSNYLNFMCTCFSRPVKNDKDYAITQFISDEIRKYGYDGLCFRSIFTNQINYVIFNCAMSNIEFEKSKIIKMCAQKTMFIDYNKEAIIEGGVYPSLSYEDINGDKLSLLTKLKTSKKIQQIRMKGNLRNGKTENADGE